MSSLGTIESFENDSHGLKSAFSRTTPENVAKEWTDLGNLELGYFVTINISLFSLGRRSGADS